MAATLKAVVKTERMRSESSGSLAATWPQLLCYESDPATREKMLADAQETHARLLAHEAAEAAKS